MLRHFTELEDTPFWHLRKPKGAEMTFRVRTLICKLSSFAMTATFYLTNWYATGLCERNQLNGLCHKKAARTLSEVP